MKLAIVIAISIILVGLAGWWGISTVVALGGFHMSGHGWFAMILGVVFTVALGGGLMGLAFYSSRHGHDDPPEIDRG